MNVGGTSWNFLAVYFIFDRKGHPRYDRGKNRFALSQCIKFLQAHSTLNKTRLAFFENSGIICFSEYICNRFYANKYENRRVQMCGVVSYPDYPLFVRVGLKLKCGLVSWALSWKISNETMSDSYIQIESLYLWNTLVWCS